MKRLFSVFSIIVGIERAPASDRWFLRGLLTIVVVAAAWFVISLSNALSVTDVRAGGTLQEGIIGTPRFVNPVLALTRADQDVTQLVYSGLVRVDTDGTLQPDLADSWAQSEDGTIYTINLRQDATFHDGIPVTSADVLYTVELIQNSELKSPLRGNWNGVRVAAVNDYQIEIILQEPYAPFIENLTVGILPVHIWRNVPIEQVPFSTHNTTPVGSGPYQIVDTDFSNSGTVAQYKLQPAGQQVNTALLSDIALKFYPDEATLTEAWENQNITSSAYLPTEVVRTSDDEVFQTTTIPLTRTFGLFFNQNKSEIVRDAAVREALELAIDRAQVVATAVDGAGIPTQTAAKSASGEVDWDYSDTHDFGQSSTTPDTLELATFVLEEAGWMQTESGTWETVVDNDIIPLQVTIRTANSAVFNDTLQAVVTAWKELGVTVATEQFTQSDLVQTVIRERDFEILLFGMDSGRAGDLYPFWHSSQQDDPGLNVAQYANLTVDEALETARVTTDPEVKTAALETINTIIQEERPAIFLFQPALQYVVTKEITTDLPQQLSVSSERFIAIADWYTEERMIWPIFTNDE